jgi:hypothetical protein
MLLETYGRFRVVNPEGSSMNTYSKLVLAFFLLVLVAPQVGADEPPENGKHVVYYDNGQKKYESHYKNGKLDGLRTQWDKNGKKVREIQYKDGVEVSRKEF